MRLTQKQETFCLKYFELGNASEAALIAGYSPRTVRAIASVNLTKVNIRNRLQELRQIAEDATIATVLERKQVLTEILRTTPANIMELSGDSKELTINRKALASPAVAYIRTEQVQLGKEGAKFEVNISRVGLIDKVRAATELNKMERIYEAEGGTVIDNRTLVINVMSDKAKELTERLIEGKRTD